MCKRLLMLAFLVLALGLVGGNTVLGSSIEIGITSGNNDAEEDINPSKLGEIDAGSSDLEMPYEDAGMGDPQFIGVRYEIGIGKGVMITDAWIQFQVDELKDGSLPVNLIIEGELNPNPGEFVGGGPGTFDISNRPRTVAQVKWSVPNWETVGDRGPAQATPNLAPILLELIAQPGWANGNAIVLIFSDDPDNPSEGNRVAEAGPGDDSATLTVEFGGDPFLQDSGPDGIVSIEAENFHNSTGRGAHAWEVVGPNDGFTGVAGVQALPNDGTNADLDQAISPSLDYEIALLKSGTYYVWLRAYGATGSDDSANVGLDGQPTDGADRIDNFNNAYVWTNRTRDPERAFLDIATGGVHTLNLWMREDGAIVDKIVLTTNPDYVPEGDGPPESGRGFPAVAVLVSPADGGIDLVDPALEWIAADAAVSHQVYLSTDATIDANDFLVDTTETMLIEALAPATSYYWRVDEVTADGTVNEGAVWSFATLAWEGHFPMPADGAVWQAQDSMLSWTAGREALVRDVFFSTDRALVEARDPSIKVGFFLSLPSHDPGPLEPGTKYYWAVDEFDSTFTAHAGPIWSFTTMDPAVDANVKSWNAVVVGAAPAYQALHVADGVYDIGQFGGEMTYEFIVRSDPCETEASMALIGRRGFGDPTAGLKYEQWNNTGTYGATIFGVVDLDFGVPTAPGEDTHLVFVSSEAASTTTLYVNGAEAGVVDRAISLSGIVGIGAAASAEDGSAFFDDFDGSIYGVAIYDEALSADAISRNATAFLSPMAIGDPSLLIHYALDSAENGIVADLSGHANFGTLMGDPQFATMDGVSALDFDGNGDYVFTGLSASDLGIAGNNSRTVTAWVYTRSFNNGGIFDVGARSTGQDFSLRTLADDNRWRIQYWGGDFDFDLDSKDKWVHFAHVHDGVNTKIYADGVLIVDWEMTIDTSDANPFQVGLYGWPGNFFDGLIGDVRVYDRALTEADVAQVLLMISDVTGPGDMVVGVPDEARDGSVAGWPGGEHPALALDDDTSTKYLHFKGEVEPTGFRVAPAVGSTVVMGLTFTTANDAPERDPITYELSGSNAGIDGPYELIAGGVISDFAGGAASPRFTKNATAIVFANDVAYAYYQVMFPVVRDAASANSMQIAEVELLGHAVVLP